ncbi:MAG: hypothetical protein ACREJB_11855 [Planctomycetaceae bacterium]
MTNSTWADEALKQRFLSEAPVAWKELRDAEVSYQGTMSYTLTDLKTKRVHEQTTREFKRTGSWALWIERKDIERRPAGVKQQSSQKRGASAYGTNSEYAFQLAQMPGRGGDAVWILERLEFHDSPSEAARELADYARRGARGPLTGGQVLDPNYLYEMIEDPTFSVEDARIVNQEGQELVELTIYHKSEASDAVTEGTVWLDPAKYWLIHEAKLQVNSPSQGIVWTSSVQKKYDNDLTEFPLAAESSVVKEIKSPGPRAVEDARKMGFPEPPTLELVYRYDLKPLEDPDEEDFMLTAFGLPEPADTSSGGFGPLWLWILIGGLLLATVGFLIRRRAA